jgi:hypothetical protein
MLFKECSSDPWPVSNHTGLPYSHKESHSHTVEALHFLYTKKKKLQTCSHFKASKYWKSKKNKCCCFDLFALKRQKFKEK